MERSEGLNWWYISLSKAIEDKDQDGAGNALRASRQRQNAMDKQRLTMLMSQTCGRRN